MENYLLFSMKTTGEEPVVTTLCIYINTNIFSQYYILQLTYLPWSTVRTAALFYISRHSAEKYKSRPRINKISCPETCFSRAFFLSWQWEQPADLFSSLSNSLHGKTESWLLGPDDSWWMDCRQTFVGHSTKRSAYVPKNLHQGLKCVVHCCW